MLENYNEGCGASTSRFNMYITSSSVDILFTNIHSRINVCLKSVLFTQSRACKFYTILGYFFNYQIFVKSFFIKIFLTSIMLPVIMIKTKAIADVLHPLKIKSRYRSTFSSSFHTSRS